MALDSASMRLVERRLQQSELMPRFLRSDGEVAEHLPKARFLLVNKAPRVGWARAEQLQLIQFAGSSAASLFPATGLSARVHVANTRGAHSDAVRDHVMMLLLALARDLPRALEQQRGKSFLPFPSVPLREQTLCVVGLGAIGATVARAATAFGLRVIGVRRSAEPHPDVSACYDAPRLCEAIAEADFTVVCLPLTDATRGCFNRRTIEQLRFGSVLINVSEGGIVDEAAVEASLRTGRLRGAALDVFTEEPLAEKSGLWTCPRLIVTPHTAGLTPNALDPVLDIFADNVACLLRREMPTHLVSRELGY